MKSAASPSREALRRIRELEAVNSQQAREVKRAFFFLYEYRAALEDRMRSHMDEADASDADGSHVGFARHHRALASGLHEAVNLLDEMWRQSAT